MKTEPAVRDVPWWENDAWRESIEKPIEEIYEFLMTWLSPEAMAEAMLVNIGSVSYWRMYPDSMSDEEETRARLLYRILATCMNYARSKEKGRDLYFQTNTHLNSLSICELLEQNTAERKVLEQVRVVLDKSHSQAPPERPKNWQL